MPKLTVEAGYEQATSQNLPDVDLEMLLSYIKSDTNYVSSERKNVKTLK